MSGEDLGVWFSVQNKDDCQEVKEYDKNESYLEPGHQREGKRPTESCQPVASQADSKGQI